MQILVDSREQYPYSFKDSRYADVEMKTAALTTGDYSLAGLTDRVAIERKELPDLVQCLGRERDRFKRELQRATGMDYFAVVIEAPWLMLAKGEYKSRMNPHSACQSVASFMAKYKIPFLFAGSRAGGEYLVWSLLRQYLEGAKKRYAEIIKAHETAWAATRAS